MAVAYEMGTVPTWTLGDRLRKAREHAGIGAADMAAELGLNRNTVGNYEAGRSTPRRSVLIAWSLRCGVPLAWLQNGENPRPAGPDEGVARPEGFEPPTFCDGAFPALTTAYPRRLVAVAA